MFKSLYFHESRIVGYKRIWKLHERNNVKPYAVSDDVVNDYVGEFDTIDDAQAFCTYQNAIDILDVLFHINEKFMEDYNLVFDSKRGVQSYILNAICKGLDTNEDIVRHVMKELRGCVNPNIVELYIKFLRYFKKYDHILEHKFFSGIPC